MLNSNLTLETVRLNQNVMTPNGTGRVQGRIYEGGYQYLICRHTIAEMTGREHGKCLTPKAVLSGLWAYELQEIRKAEAGKA